MFDNRETKAPKASDNGGKKPETLADVHGPKASEHKEVQEHRKPASIVDSHQKPPKEGL